MLSKVTLPVRDDSTGISNGLCTQDSLFHSEDSNSCWPVSLVVRLNAGREASSNLLATHPLILLAIVLLHSLLGVS